MRLEAANLLATQHTEPILRPESRTYAFEIRDTELWELYELQLASFWQPAEIDASRDVGQWETLSADERHFVSHVLAFFATADGIVLDNININFSSEVHITEAKHFYGMQAFMENIHSQVYMSLLKAYITDGAERSRLIHAISDVPCIRDKAKWAQRHFDVSVPFATRLIAFAIVEGVFFSGAFCAIFWLKKFRRGLLEALTLSNQFISRDESIHTMFAVALFHRLENHPTEADVHALMRDAVGLEAAFTCESLRVGLVGIDAGRMKNYIEFVADRLLIQLGYAPLFLAPNPFAFMDMQSLRVNTNFFEGKVHEYALARGGAYAEDAAF